MKVAIDIDDCLAKYMPVFLERVAEHYGVRISLNALNRYSAKTEDYGYISQKQARKLLSRDKKDRVLLNLPAHDGAAAAVNKIAESNTIILLTSRDNYELKLLRTHTTAWLRNQGFTFHHLVFTKNKGEAVKKLNIDLLIDDSLKFAKQAAQAGAKVIVYAQPWNDGYTKFLGNFSRSVILRQNKWGKIAKYIEQRKIVYESEEN